MKLIQCELQIVAFRLLCWTIILVSRWRTNWLNDSLRVVKQ